MIDPRKTVPFDGVAKFPIKAEATKYPGEDSDPQSHFTLPLTATPLTGLIEESDTAFK